jgi:uncharacterized membrane protein
MSNRLVKAAIAGALATGFVAVSSAQSGPAPTPKFAAEKCYGVAKKGSNDCQTSASACAGTSTKDAQADAWIYVPKGTCERIVGASLKKK